MGRGTQKKRPNVLTIYIYINRMTYSIGKVDAKSPPSFAADNSVEPKRADSMPFFDAGNQRLRQPGGQPHGIQRLNPDTNSCYESRSDGAGKPNPRKNLPKNPQRATEGSSSGGRQRRS